jgi:hypothetical protein
MVVGVDNQDVLRRIGRGGAMANKKCGEEGTDKYNVSKVQHIGPGEQELRFFSNKRVGQQSTWTVVTSGNRYVRDNCASYTYFPLASQASGVWQGIEKIQ